MVLPFNGDIRLATWIGCVNSWFTLLGAGVLPVLQERLRMGWAVGANLAGRAVTLACALGAIALGLGLAGAAWAYVIGAVATTAVQLGAVSRMVSLRPTVDLPYSRRLLRESSLLGAATSVGLVAWRIDSVILALLRNSREVGLYSTAYRFIDLTGAVVSVMVNSMFPSLTRFASEGDSRLRGLVDKTFDLVLAVSVPIAVIAFCFAPEIMELVGGADFRPGAVALRILAAVAVAAALSALLERGLLAAGRERFLLVINAAALALNVVLNVALIPPYGFRAAAATTIACEVLWIALAAVGFRAGLGFLPVPRSLPVVVAGAIAMVAVVLVAPLPAVSTAPIAVAAYATIVCLLPGTVRDLIGTLAAGRLRARTT
jgi:O-antigen/teichoic acid export membrane protein